MQTIIKVTQKHIDKGCKESSSNCPIAHAAIDATRRNKPYVGVSVENKSIRFCYVTGNGKTIRVVVRDLPYEAQRFIRSFDSGDGPVHPFSFPLDIPEHLVKKAA